MKVVKIIDHYNFVIDVGYTTGSIKIGDKYIVYLEGEEIIDPDTKDSLGALELPKARCQVTHIQEKISIIKSLDAKPKGARSSIYTTALTLSSLMGDSGDSSPYNFIPSEERIVKVGDKIRKEEES